MIPFSLGCALYCRKYKYKLLVGVVFGGNFVLANIKLLWGLSVSVVRS